MPFKDLERVEKLIKEGQNNSASVLELKLEQKSNDKTKNPERHDAT